MTTDNRVAIISTMSQARRYPNAVHRDEVQPMPLNKGKHQMLLRRLGAPVAATAGTFDKPIHRWISREGETVDYWDGEPDAQ